MKKLCIILFALIFLSFGCRTLRHSEVCTHIPDGERSVLCEASDKLNVSLETIATGLKVGNLAGLMGDLYLAQEAVDFIDRVDDLLGVAEKKGVSYATFIEVTKSLFGVLPPEVQALFVIVEDYANIAIPQISDYFLTAYDYKLLRLHLEKQRMIVAPFLIGD